MPNPSPQMLVIGDEILSGRTRDANMHYLAGQLTESRDRSARGPRGRDDTAAIVWRRQRLSQAHETVFTIGWHRSDP